MHTNLGIYLILISDSFLLTTLANTFQPRAISLNDVWVNYWVYYFKLALYHLQGDDELTNFLKFHETTAMAILTADTKLTDEGRKLEGAMLNTFS